MAFKIHLSFQVTRLCDELLGLCDRLLIQTYDLEDKTHQQSVQLSDGKGAFIIHTISLQTFSFGIIRSLR